MKKTLSETWIDVYSRDIAANPTHYKAHVRDNPKAEAAKIIDGLDDDSIRHMLRSLRAEIRSIAHIKASQTVRQMNAAATARALAAI